MIAVLVAAGVVLAVSLYLLHRADQTRRDGSQELREALRLVERTIVQADAERRDLTNRFMHLLNRSYDVPPIQEARDVPHPLDGVDREIILEPGSLAAFDGAGHGL